MKVRELKGSAFIMQCATDRNNTGPDTWLWKWTIIHHTALKLYYLPQRPRSGDLEWDWYVCA